MVFRVVSLECQHTFAGLGVLALSNCRGYMAQKQIYQIYYDQETRAKLQAGFLPLDNTENKRPDWFEFWVILNFLEKNQLAENTWYGFLSPKFRQKSGIESGDLLGMIDAVDPYADVLLVDHCWDQIAYFKNIWEQGEIWHPGLKELTQYFLQATGRNIQLDEIVTSSTTAVFSNYIIAKKKYWLAWLQIAKDFFNFVEQGAGKERLNGFVSYGSIHRLFPMKTFVQERFPSILLTQSYYRVLNIDTSDRIPPSQRLFEQDHQTRRLLQTCNMMKSLYEIEGDNSYLEMYFKLRDRIQIKWPKS